MVIRVRSFPLTNDSDVHPRTEADEATTAYSRTARTDAVLSHWRIAMGHPYWNDWYFSWGWLLWLAVVFLILS